MADLLDKLRMPLGSLVVDAGLVLTLAFTAGQITSRLEAMDLRLARVEQSDRADRVPERMATLESKAAQADRDRAEILEALHRIEAKLDGKADKVR